MENFKVKYNFCIANLAVTEVDKVVSYICGALSDERYELCKFHSPPDSNYVCKNYLNGGCISLDAAFDSLERIEPLLKEAKQRLCLAKETKETKEKEDVQKNGEKKLETDL